MLSEQSFRFNSHPKVEGTHAFLSPSKYHWLRDDAEKLIARLENARATERGTRLHAWAAEAITFERYQPRDGDYICHYINDALDLGLQPEVQLFYSFNNFGQADAIGFDPVECYLRVHDLKTGVTKPSFDQLYVYAAIFCLEYEFRPFDINGELRIYQSTEIMVAEIDRAYLAFVYDTIYSHNQTIEEWRIRKGGTA
ncbi:DNA helicase [Streptomyces phage GirlPower]|nr:DNA helicase [Streptomyces phage GirlPower]